MEINLEHNYSSYYLNVKADNVHITEDITNVSYALKEDGKKDFSKRTGYDITDSGMESIARVMEDMAYYRVKEFDSTDLIEQLFNKLPEDKKQYIIDTLEI